MSNEWVSVEDRLPIGIGDVLLFSTSGKIYLGDLYRHNVWRISGLWKWNGFEWETNIDFKDITHWMPLPQPPK